MTSLEIVQLDVLNMIDMIYEMILTLKYMFSKLSNNIQFSIKTVISLYLYVRTEESTQTNC